MAVKVILEREEVLASIIALQKEKKPGEWSKSALRKLDDILRVNKEVKDNSQTWGYLPLPGETED